MTRRTIPGGSYVDALPSGDYACLIPNQTIVSSRGDVPLPPSSGAGLLRLRMFAGVNLLLVGMRGDEQGGPNDGHVFYWNGVEWRDKGPSYGITPGAFGPTGLLYLAEPDHGVQGIRAITADGQIIWGDPTYYDPALQINEYTRLGDVTIGQGQEGGVIVVYQGQRKRLAEGLCYFVRFTRDGDRLAVAWWDGARTAFLVWLNVSEIAGLPDAPIVSTPAPIPVPVPNPEPPPVNTPQAFIALIVNAGRTIDRRFPGLRERDGHGWAKKVAYLAHLSDPRVGGKGRNAGHLSIDTFGYAQSPQSASGPVPFFGVSIIRENPPINEWRAQPHDYGLIADGQWWIKPEPVDVGGGSGQQPQNPQNPQTPPSADLVALVLDLRKRVAALEDRPFPQRIALKTAHGMYVVAEPNGSLAADRSEAGAWETLTVEAK